MRLAQHPMFGIRGKDRDPPTRSGNGPESLEMPGKMKTMRRIGRVLLLLALAASPVTAQTQRIQLKNGAVIVGTVRVSGVGEVTVQVRYPEVRRLKLERKDVSPESWFEILERTLDPTNIPARIALADFAEKNGLYSFAVAELRRLAEFAPEKRGDLLKKIDAIQDSVAFEILEDAENALERGQPNAALMYLHTILERFPKSGAAAKARELMKKAHRAAGTSASVAEKTVPDSKMKKQVAMVMRHFEAGRKILEKGKGHIGRYSKASRQRRTLEKALRSFRAAWREARKLPVSSESKEAGTKLSGLRERVKKTLVQTYLDLGSLFLQRLAIQKAEEYCNAACELDPGNRGSHELHGLIIQAKIYRGY